MDEQDLRDAEETLAAVAGLTPPDQLEKSISGNGLVGDDDPMLSEAAGQDEASHQMVSNS